MSFDSLDEMLRRMTICHQDYRLFKVAGGNNSAIRRVDAEGNPTGPIFLSKPEHYVYLFVGENQVWSNYVLCSLHRLYAEVSE